MHHRSQFWDPNQKNFLGGGCAPVGRGTPPPHPSAPRSPPFPPPKKIYISIDAAVKYIILNWPAIRHTGWAKKVGPQTHDHNSVKPILIIFHWKIPSFFSSVLARRAKYMTRSWLYLCQIFTNFKFFFTDSAINKKSFLNLIINNPTTP